MVLNWFKKKKSKEEIELECANFRKKERELIWESLFLENLLDNIKFEECAYREPQQTEKKLFTYDKSLERIKKDGLERHARPQEVFGVIIAGLEDKLDASLQKINEDMLKSYGEWLSCAFERQGNKLFAYLDPEGLMWNQKQNKYVVQGELKYAEKKEFDITGINSTQWTDLNKFNEEFIKYMYGKKCSDLPAEIKEGSKKAQVYLPPDKTVCPVGRGNYVDGYVVYCCYYFRASRGVVVGAKKAA